MNPPSGLDIRLSVGMLFTLLGGVLTTYGLVNGSPSTRIDVWWGAVMLVFGLTMLVASRRHSGTR